MRVITPIAARADIVRAPFWFLDEVADTLPLGIVYGCFARIEAEPYLAVHVAGACPAHQRINPARLCRHEFKHPFARVPLARGHRTPRRKIDPAHHRLLHRLYPRLIDTFAG